MSREDVRRQVLAAHGADASVVDELLAYGRPLASGETGTGAGLALPLADEPHADAWRRYAEEARRDGASDALRRHFVQVRFPIEAGISQQDAYRRATRQGRFEAADVFAPGLALARPAGVSIDICATMGGAVPVITVTDRNDFVALVRAFTERNEPADVPDAMGACLVRGLNNWSRVADYRADWERRQTAAGASGVWTDEFARLAARKELYQDRLVILSRGPYSAVPASQTELDETDWLARSLIIRREHEFTHYFTYRVFGSIRSHVLDELVADFVGLVHAFGRYRPDLALRFLGLESYPALRADGRLGVYRGQPPLSDAAMTVVAGLAVAIVRNLGAIDAAARVAPSDLASMGRLTLALFSVSLEELASPEGPQLVLDRAG